MHLFGSERLFESSTQFSSFFGCGTPARESSHAYITTYRLRRKTTSYTTDLCMYIHTEKRGSRKATNITYMQMIYLYIDSHKEALRSHVINIHRELDALHIY